MKVKVLKYNIVLSVYNIDKATGVVTLKIFGTLCKFSKSEYEVVKDDNPTT